MKKFVITSVALVSILFANAQKKSTEPTLGFRIGANLSNVTTSDNQGSFDASSKLGLSAAAFLELPIIKSFAIQPELQFSQKGYQAKGTFFAQPYEYKQTTNWIEVPVLAKFKPTSSFGVFLGPQFSFLTSTNTTFTSGNTVYQNNVNNDNDNLKKNILGGVIGFEASSNNLVVGLRYSLDFQNNNGDGTSSTPKYKNQVLGLSLGIKL